MIGLYLSGTGNTEHCIKEFLRRVDETAEAIPLEDARAREALREHALVVLGYPIQFSNLPVMVRDFIRDAGPLWEGKRVFCLATMGAFSGDGSGCAARLLRARGALIVGGLHVRMPDSVCDSKLLKKTREENREIVRRADEKLAAAAEQCRAGNDPREGLGVPSHLLGLLGQRLWFSGKTRQYSRDLTISSACVGCGLCAGLCPMGNIAMAGGRAVPGDHCTMCYRCISSCPQKAITLLGREVVEQYRFEKLRP